VGFASIAVGGSGMYSGAIRLRHDLFFLLLYIHRRAMLN